MTKSRIIKEITTSGTSTRVGYDANNHLANLGLDVKPVVLGTDVPDFVNEVRRKVHKHTKFKDEE